MVLTPRTIPIQQFSFIKYLLSLYEDNYLIESTGMKN